MIFTVWTCWTLNCHLLIHYLDLAVKINPVTYQTKACGRSLMNFAHRPWRGLNFEVHLTTSHSESSLQITRSECKKERSGSIWALLSIELWQIKCFFGLFIPLPSPPFPSFLSFISLSVSHLRVALLKCYLRHFGRNAGSIPEDLYIGPPLTGVQCSAQDSSSEGSSLPPFCRGSLGHSWLYRWGFRLVVQKLMCLTLNKFQVDLTDSNP